MPSIRGLRWCRYSTEKCLPDSHLPFIYIIILSISPNWRIGETNSSTKTSKKLFSIIMPTFGKCCRRPWLHGLKKQSYVGSSSKFSKMAATRPARGRWAGSTPENLPVSDSGNMFKIFLIKFAKYLILEACWLWFVILKKICGIIQGPISLTTFPS